jgi:hypothetical protein
MNLFIVLVLVSLSTLLAVAEVASARHLCADLTRWHTQVQARHNSEV